MALSVIAYTEKRSRLLESLNWTAYRRVKHRTTEQSFLELNERRAVRGLPPIEPMPETKPEKP